MKTFKIIIYTILTSVIVSCSTSKKTQIADKRDYNKYIQNIETASTSLAQTELNFWQEKLKDQPTQYPYLSKLALAKIEDYSDFDYLIRVSKRYDHKGYLSSAIRFMEKAMKKAEEANDKDLKVWSYTNLADFYGHNG